ncbi:S8 family serine peptidase [Marinobacter changyiensis]|uniref:S8 family serine peptidase n=1 Tax=Marinobacter changyiensis TaxID=2604091 RepID=UPI0015D24947|nr:S8 family serine peptidase [Marinobacter changyiensis]
MLMSNRSFVSQVAIAVIVVLASINVSMASSQGAQGKALGKSRFTNSAYIVQMADMPVSAYTGGISGYEATKPRNGQKIDINSRQVANYKSYLESRHDDVLAQVGGAKKLYSYGYVFSGFAAEMTPAQATKLAQIPGVIAVSKDEFRELVTATTPAFLGLSGADGFWNMTAKGEDVIIGIVDSGIWPEHPSFYDRTGNDGNASKNGMLSYLQIPGWNGKCVPGEDFNASLCNQKLISARFFNEGFGGNAGIDANLPFEFNSPRDHNGHGTHTATTAGGNADVVVTGPGAGVGRISGIAPRARIASYKACWSVPGTAGSCASVDLLAAIDQAVADGVDVINYSISGSRTNFRDPVQIAFLFAADAGVFVAASAGNSGPFSSTVAHPSPWITTVAAGTHDREATGSATLGNGISYSGASVAAAVGPKTLVDAANAGLAGANPAEAELCYPGTLDPSQVADTIVLCRRGNIALTSKSLAVQQAGGAGMVLYNPVGSSLTADLHLVPSVHVDNVSGPAIKAYAATAGATATINQALITNTAPAPFTANFSSRGPLQASGDLLKPDVIAPGVDILAGVAPPNNGGKLFDLYSGTSMSSPHVAGLAALFKELQPDWSPMAIKSALMTSAGDVLDGLNTNPQVIFRQGAGHVRPNHAIDPGLVFDSNFADWLSFICGVQPGGGCTGVMPIDPSDFNVASIAIGSMAGSQTVTRRVTNVSGKPATFTASASGLTDMTVSVSPSTLDIGAGETKAFSVTLTNAGATFNAHLGGQLAWSDGTTAVRVPIVVRPVALGVPTEVSGSFSVSFGYTGMFSATPRGLVPAAVMEDTVMQDPDQTFNAGDSAGTIAVEVEVPGGTTYARFRLFDADVEPGSDLDLYLYGPNGNFVGGSANGNSDEIINASNPIPGTYTVYVHGWGVPSGSSPLKLYTWVLGSDGEGNMTVTAPASATVGETATIDLAFSNLAPETRYLGSIGYSGIPGLPAPTIVRVDGP